LRFENYVHGEFFDEYFGADGKPWPETELLVHSLQELSDNELSQRQESAEASLLHLGITFNVYGDERGTEKIMPFDILPRIVSSEEWQRLEAGLKQRIEALNLFLDDIYHDQKILKDGVVREDVIRSAASFRDQCLGQNPPNGVWCHITGTDLVRDGAGVIHVLEDNLRCPSGVSYVLENREVMKRTFPQIFDGLNIRPVNDYPSKLLEVLESLSGKPSEDTQVVVLTPGPANSAYFEHSYLAMQMGVPLVEGRDLEVSGDIVHMRTTQGLKPVDVIYRRIDDDFLDPLAFRPDSLLGVPGLMQSYRAGRVAIANAPGCGVADDKAVYTFVPKMIRYYLDADPILPNVPTYLCWVDEEREYVLKNLDSLVVKSANEAGGYGMLIGPASTEEMRADFAKKILKDPRNYIAQPTLALSRVPVLTDTGTCEGRHVDLRPYILNKGKDIFVLPGGLTRVALRKGSLVVNSSQGGGSKDTWVLGPA
jgi:uncharacterized circularly permuted ATP-grasp superfamily protein